MRDYLHLPDLDLGSASKVWYHLGLAMQLGVREGRGQLQQVHPRTASAGRFARQSSLRPEARSPRPEALVEAQTQLTPRP